MTRTLRTLLEEGTVRLAQLPAKNEVSLEALDHLAGYTVPLTIHDYGAKTPVMWNTAYEHLGLNLRNIMVVADPNNVKTILDTFREDPKYLGGGAAVGFKETVIPHLDEVRPADLSAVNIIVKEGQKLVGYNTDALGLYQSIADEIATIGRRPEGARYVVFGAGGVAKEFCRILARKSASRIAIVNRTYEKAVSLAHELNSRFGRGIAYGAPEEMIRGIVLNTLQPAHVIVNCTEKGSDGALEDTNAFAPAGEYNKTYGWELLRLLRNVNPKMVIVDITLPKSGRSVTLRLAESAGLEHLVDGRPMVVNQAAPAYKLVETAHSHLHERTVSEEELLTLMRDAASMA